MPIDIYSRNIMLSSGKFQEEKQFWLQKLNVLTLSRVTPDSHLRVNKSYQVESLSLSLPDGNVQQLFTKSNHSDYAMFVYVLSALKILLSKYNGQQDISVAMPPFKAEHTNDLSVDEFFVLRTLCEKEATFKEFLLQVRDTVSQARKYRNLPYRYLADLLDLENPNDRSSFPIAVVWSDLHEMPNLHELQADLLFAFIKTESHIKMELHYNATLYDRATIERLSQHFLHVLDVVLVHVDTPISNIELISEMELQQIQFDFNNTATDFPKEQTIIDLFEAQVVMNPEQSALLFGNRSLSYREVNEQANRLARSLRTMGVQPDQIVGVMLDRSPEMMISLLAVLKAGGAYLPISQSLPSERIRYILEDSNSRFLLTRSHFLENIEFTGECVDVGNESLYVGDGSDLPRMHEPSHLAYVIYTSGTTGKPKGAGIEHRSLVNRLHWMQKKYSIGPGDTILQKTPFTFDVSVWELFWWSFTGARVCFLAVDGEKDPNVIIETIEQAQVTVMHFVPSMLNVFLEYLELLNQEHRRLRSLKQVFASGEALNAQQVRRFQRIFADHGTRLTNLYGPTEATIDVSYYDCLTDDANSVVPIGKPIDNIQLYVLSQEGHMQPIGVAGELHIGGVGLARGYLNRSEMTAEKFVPNPFLPGQRMYRTGDLARWMPDGNLEYLGRLDHQVKIRGYRIELGEIEYQLLQHPMIREAVLVARDDVQGDKYLCAYAVTDHEPSLLEIKEMLAQELPEYMVPAHFVWLKKMPLSGNGKVDRNALPAPTNNMGTMVSYTAPRNDMESKLAELWQEVLGLERVGIDDDFFALGGHSLKATTLMSKMHKEFQVGLTLREIFKYSTIRGLAEYIEAAEMRDYQGIERAEEREYYPVTTAQKGLFVQEDYQGLATTYNMPRVLLAEGLLDVEKFEHVFRELIKRHEILRTSFHYHEGEMVQKVHANVEFHLSVIDVVDEEIQQQVSHFIKPFDLKSAPLMRARLLRLAEDRHVLLFDMHHMISDGVSMDILVKEFEALLTGRSLPSLTLQYKDFAVWQHQQMQRGDHRKQEEYWLIRFQGELPVLNIPLDFPRPPLQSFEGGTYRFWADKDLRRDLNRLGSRTGTTMYMILLAAFTTLLAKYSGQDDMIVGTPIAGRPHAELQNILGMFVNILAMRSTPEPAKTFMEFLAEVKESSLEAFEQQDFQFEELVDKLEIRRDWSRNPLFDTMFIMQNIDHRKVLEIDGLRLSGLEFDYGRAKYDLSLDAFEEPEGLFFQMEYSSRLFKSQTIKRLAEHFTQLLYSIVKDPEQSLGELNMMSEAEKQLVLHDFNDTSADYPQEQTIIDLFEDQVRKTPELCAVLFESRSLSYRKVNEQANRLARTLRTLGVQPDQVVGVMLERSPEMMISLLAVLKAGGAFLPIIPSLPSERIRFLLEDSKAQVLLTHSHLIQNIDFAGHCVDVGNDEVYAGDGSDLLRINETSHLAYVIYTSGTTGKPKGVEIEHRSLVNKLHWMQKQYSLGPGDTILQKTPITFDASIWELFGWSFTGARVCFLGVDDEKDPKAIIEMVERAQVTIMHFVPSMLNVFLEYLEQFDHEVWRLRSLKQVFAGGEALKVEQVRRFYRLFAVTKTQLSNQYGPTEATIDVAIYDCPVDEANSVVPIGKPIDNIQLYVLSQEGHVQPVGVAGELHIGGVGLARGYLSRPELTVEKFVPNPFLPGQRIYRTGDLVRWRPDGNLEYIGRIDHQVKIRGYRIELGEIENQLLRHPEIREAAVVALDDSKGDKYLCAYLVAGQMQDSEVVKAMLAQELPEYMIPAQVMWLEQMPVTSNGKLNRKALPVPTQNLLQVAVYTAPRDETETKLALLWQEVLGLERVGVEDNFFALGGHSLKAITLLTKIHKEFKVDISLREIFQLATLEELAEFIKSAQQKVHREIRHVTKQDAYPLSSAQKRLYLLDHLTEQSTVYHMSGAARIYGSLNLEHLQKVFLQLIQRHESLRTSFELVNGEPMQKVHEEVDFEIEVLNGTEEQMQEVLTSFIRAFDLQRAPLLRVGLMRVRKDEHLLVFDLHHIISDGVSMAILFEEIAALYQAEELPELKVQYKDFAIWQNQFFNEGEAEEQERFWLDTFSGEIPILQLPTDYPRLSQQSFEGDSIRFEIERELSEKLQVLAQRTGATPYMVLLASYNILLALYSGQDDIIIGTPIAGRHHADLLKTIGVFVNTLAMRNRPALHKTFEAFLGEVKENAIQAYENQDYQFEDLVDKVAVRRDWSRNPLFDVMFNLDRTRMDHELKFGDLLFQPVHLEDSFSKFDLELEAMQMEEALSFNLKYCTRLFKRETIQRMIEHYVGILEMITADSKLRLSEIKRSLGLDSVWQTTKHELTPTYGENVSVLMQKQDQEWSQHITQSQRGVEDLTQPGTRQDVANHVAVLENTSRKDAVFEAPTTDEEEWLAALWKELLGLEHIGVHENFFNIGGNSLKIISMAARIYENFGIKLPIQEVLESPTIRKLSEMLGQQKKDFIEDRPIMLLNSKHAKSIFAFPGQGGFGIVFSQLAQLLKGHSLYAFNFVEHADLISYYADLMQQIQVHGPYVILGYSAGGNLAFETAQELIHRNQQVTALLMLDTIPDYQHVDFVEGHDQREQIFNEIVEFLDANPHYASQVSDVNTLVDIALEKIKGITAYLKNLSHEVPIDVPIYLIEAEGAYEKDWSKLTLQGVSVHKGSGKHEEMISSSQHVLENSKLIQEILNIFDSMVL